MAKAAAVCNRGRNVREYPITGGETFVEGAAVLATAGELVECGADPLVILGFALHDAGADPLPTKCLVGAAKDASTFWLEGSRDPALTDRDLEYGITKDADGQWYVDAAKTGASARLHVEDVDLTRLLWEVSIIAANRQLAQ